ncbi:MAG: alpha-L-fucosidase [Bacteroidota bacterium]|nr:alpha-L-fucosidase [Bacteroidota bacterium]
MKKTLLILSLLFVQFTVFSQTESDRDKRLKWWTEARFGMFIHFGTYAIPARGEWVKSVEKIPNEQYIKYFEQFNPYLFDAKEWARTAKQAGMKYVVLTAKHHEGFALWDTKLSDYKITNTPFKRDLIKEYVEALRAEGIKVGLYFSIIDWYHPDYPKYKDPHHPMSGVEKYKDEKTNWDNYLKFMHGQVRELCTNYGQIDVMWFDFSYGEMKGEKWKAKELVQMVRSLQPNIILNNRLLGDGATAFDENSLGDFETPEQAVPDSMRVDAKGKMIPWESCLTLNNSWGYNRYDNNWKSTQLVIHTLVNCVSKGGNLLLNVGPDANGKIPAKSLEILGEVGNWMQRNGNSIYGCGPSKFPNQNWGVFTQKGKLLYAHKMYPTIGPIKMKNYFDKVKRVNLLRDGSQVMPGDKFWGEPDATNILYINLEKPAYLTYPMPDKDDTVFEIELK